MKRSIFLVILGMSALTSCQTTGDPSQGGLFGWSRPQADERIYQRERRLDHLDQDTAYQRRRSRELESELARREGSNQ